MSPARPRPSEISARARPGGGNFPAALFGKLLDVRSRALEVAEQVRSGDNAGLARAMASDLASRLGDVASLCRRQSDQLFGMRELSHEVQLAADAAAAVRAAMAGDFRVTITSALDYELARAEAAAQELIIEIGKVQQGGRNAVPQKGRFVPRTSDRQREEEGRRIDAVLNDLIDQDEETPPVVTSASASRVLAAASRLLPASDRERYAREFDSELWELASAGEGKLAQLQYATRQALRTGRVRSEVLAPRSRSAGP